MPFNPLRPLAAVLAVALAAAPAGAQERPSEFDSWVLPGWSVTPGVSFSVMRDSNATLSGRGTELRPSLADNVFVLVPFGQIDLISPRTDFTAGYRGSLRRYADIGALNGYDQHAYAELRHRATPRLTWFLQNEFTDTPTTDVTELYGVPFERVGSLSNRLGAGIESRLTKYTDLTVRYENFWSRFDRQSGVPASVLAGGTIHGFRADISRRLSERLRVGAEGRIRRSDITRLEPRVIWFQDAGAAVNYRLTEFVSVTLAGGMSHVRDSRLEESRNTPYFRAELERQTERATAGVAFERGYSPSFAFSGSNNNTEIRGYVRMPFSRNRFYVQSDGTWRRGSPVFAEEIQLDTFLSNNTFGYSLSRWLRMEAYYAFSLQDSVITGGEVERHRVGAQLVISQPMRIR